MVWKADETKHVLEISHRSSRNGEIYYAYPQEYEPASRRESMRATTIEVPVYQRDTEVIVKPYKIETLRSPIGEEYPVGRMEELFVGIRNETSVDSVGFFWTEAKYGSRRMNQYFFKDDEPSAFNFGDMSGPGWPLDGQILDETLAKHLLTLKDVRPLITESLDRCVVHLTAPGEESAGPGTTTFQLPE